MFSNDFICAKPVWLRNKEKEMNLTVGLRTDVGKISYDKVVLKVATSGIYRYFINGIFAGYGPARAAKGFFRIDEWDITKYLDREKNIVAIEVICSNVNSFYIIDQGSFVQAEVIGDNIEIAATKINGSSFEIFEIKDRIRKVDRYSFQRTFTEVYDLNEGYDSWRIDSSVQVISEPCVEVEEVKILERRVPYPVFDIRYPISVTAEGNIKVIKPQEYWEPYFIKIIGNSLKGFTKNEVEVSLRREFSQLINESISYDEKSYKTDTLFVKENTFNIFDFGANFTGFLGAKISCSSDVKLYFIFDEVLMDGDVSYKRYNCINGIQWRLKKGRYTLESIEPYTLRYLKIIVVEGSVSIEGLYLREYCNSNANNAVFNCSDKELDKIFEGGRQTFVQNAVDIYMDCPSRERAGWLCDSYFTARVEKWLTGKSLVEKNFLENYLIADKFDFLPEGMLPMCYPADHNDGKFIPNWSLWFIVQLEEYLNRTGDVELINEFKNRVLCLFKYFERFRNEDGLLEKLESWVFVEWSKANDFVQDVNYPTNMLYAYAMEVAGRLYGIDYFIKESKIIKNTIIRQSYDGKFFVDNAIREGEKLRITNNSTEVCQYYAFFFGIASPETHSLLWNTLIKDFGPDRKITKKYENVYFANAFIGNYLRMELLSRYGVRTKLIEELKGYFLYMTTKTGTLWEHDNPRASCNHGFASHVINHLYKDVAGISSIDDINKIIYVKISSTNLKYCNVEIPVENSIFKISWIVQNNNIQIITKVPEGYNLNIENDTNMNLVLL